MLQHSSHGLVGLGTSHVAGGVLCAPHRAGAAKRCKQGAEAEAEAEAAAAAERQRSVVRPETTLSIRLQAE